MENLQRFDRRTVELFLTRMVEQSPPAHLADLSIFRIQEVFGREKRFRYYTLKGYTQLMASENPDYSPDNDDTQRLSFSGSYSLHNPDEFYRREADLVDHLKKYRPEGLKGQGQSRKLGRPKKQKEFVPATESGLALEEPEIETPLGESSSGKKNEKRQQKPKEKEKSKKVKKEKEYKNPVLPDGTRKRGRPVKDPEIAEQRRQKKLKKDEERKKAMEEGETGEKKYATRKKRKISYIEDGETEIESVDGVPSDIIGTVEESHPERQTTVEPPQTRSEPSTVKRKRGRPPKRRRIEQNSDTPIAATSQTHQLLPSEHTTQDIDNLDATSPSNPDANVISCNEPSNRRYFFAAIFSFSINLPDSILR